jgi:hypothetical protein
MPDAAGTAVNKTAKLLTYGTVVAMLYALLYFYDREVVELCGRGGWWFAFPVTVAFVFSIFHGNFTGLFWDVLGVRPKSKR